MWLQGILFVLMAWGAWRILKLELRSPRNVVFRAPEWPLGLLDTAIVLWVGCSFYILAQWGLQEFYLPRIEGPLFKEWKHCGEALSLHLSVATGAFVAWVLSPRSRPAPSRKPFFQGFEAYAMALPLVWLVSLGWGKLIQVIESFQVPLNAEPQKLVGLIENVNSPWMMGIFGSLAIVTAPLAEELFFRGMLYPIFKLRVSARWANLLTAFIFAFIHANLLSFLPLFLLSLLLVNAYERSGSIKSPFFFHALFNAQNFLMILITNPLK